MGPRIKFIHIPKTGGRYIRILLQGKFLQGRIFDDTSHDFALKPVWNRAVSGTGPSISYTSNGDWQSYMYFSIIRNPFDLLHSYYLHTRSNYSGFAGCNTIHNIASFPDFIEKYCDPDFQWHVPLLKHHLFSQLFLPGGKLLPKMIVRFEHYKEGLQQLFDECGIRVLGWPPKANQTQGKVDYRTVYTPSMKAMVEKKCQRELKDFGYTFSGPTDDVALLHRDQNLPGVTFAHEHLPGVYVS